MATTNDETTKLRLADALLMRWAYVPDDVRRRILDECAEAAYRAGENPEQARIAAALFADQRAAVPLPEAGGGYSGQKAAAAAALHRAEQDAKRHRAVLRQFGA